MCLFAFNAPFYELFVCVCVVLYVAVLINFSDDWLKDDSILQTPIAKLIITKRKNDAFQ